MHNAAPQPRLASVGVIIPMYNAGSTAVHAVESVFAQVGGCVSEIVVIDDGSTDAGAQILLEKFRNSIVPVRILATSNGGAANARSHGMRHCGCDFYAFLDSDDTWFPEKLSKQMALFERSPEIGMVGCLTTMGAKVPTGDAFRDHPVERRVSLKNQLFKNHFQTSTVIVRREVVERVGGFPQDQRHAEEGDFFNRIAAKYPAVLLGEVLVDYGGGKHGFGASGLSADLVAMEKGELRNIVRAYSRGECGIGTYAAATLYSLVKFVRRLMINLSRSRQEEI